MECEDCKGSGYIKTEGAILGRPYYHPELKQIVTPYYPDGIWKRTICPCQSDKD